MKQRELIRQLHTRFRADRDRCIKAYAEAERTGSVERRSNQHTTTAEAYAAALFADGVRKAWF